MPDQKQYVGSGWGKQFSNGGSVINIKIKKSEIEGLTPNQYGDIALVVGQRKSPDTKTKATHWVAVDTYVPKAETANKKDGEDLPF